MLRRVKDDSSRQKALNQSLQAELDSFRGTNSSEAGDRTRNVNSGRVTPVSEDAASVESYRSKLADAQRQISTLSRSTSELATLKTEHTSLQSEHARLKEAYTTSLDEANDRIDALTLEVERLGQLSAGAADVKRIQMDYADLKTENEDLQRKIRLLLDAQDYGQGGAGGRGSADRESELYGSEDEASGDDYDEEGLNR